MIEELEILQNSWYSSLEELQDDIKEAGFAIEEANREYITASYEEDDETVYVDIRLGGTESTITVDSVTELERV